MYIVLSSGNGIFVIFFVNFFFLFSFSHIFWIVYLFFKYIYKNYTTLIVY